MAEHFLRATLTDGSEHVLALPRDVTPKDALNSFLEDSEGVGMWERKEWLYTTRLEWIRRDAIVRLTLDEEEPGVLLGESKSAG